ncbi:ribose-phosphate pyrophosphokinase [Cystobasidium minutum MCA 4210]|uniref:ribose-phosphate pyrophosphokinase n=1 Tax=Cystobasidium minutum MCA 4210 TaxID=1397322 RepID=UPI0034CE56EB|eukprot:jgi/Rhomi1/147528/e_gw1.8.177.1
MPSSNFNSIKLFTGSSHPELAYLVSKRLGIPLSDAGLIRKPSGEIGLDLQESVREADVYILNTASSSFTPTNAALMETMIMCHACKIASARRITAVLPHFPYARQDKKDKSRAPITAKLVANMLQSSGVDHVITMDLHASQIQGFFDVPLYAEPTMVQYLKQTVDVENAVIVSPDAGGAKRASSLAAKLNLEFALFHKERKKANEVSRMVLVGNVTGKTAILVDDMADTCGTLALAAENLEKAGAKSVMALVTHGILSSNALEKIAKSKISQLVVTNTLPQEDHMAACDRIKMLDISHVLAETIRRSHYGESVSYLFDAMLWDPIRIDYAQTEEEVIMEKGQRVVKASLGSRPPTRPGTPKPMEKSSSGMV